MNVRTVVLILGLFSILSTATGGYFYYHSIQESARKETEDMILSTSNALEDDIVRITSFNNGAVRALSGFGQIRQALTDKGSEESLLQANLILDHFAAGLSYDVCFLIDRSGKCIGSSNRNQPDSFVGVNYFFRNYFQEAIQGRPGLELALGIRTGIRGIFVSHPVYSADSPQPLGVAVIKVSTRDIDRFFSRVRNFNALLVNSDGMIFASNREDWILNLMLPRSSEELARIAETKQFGNGPWNVTGLRLKTDNELVDGSGAVLFMRQVSVENCPGWNIVLLYYPKTLYKKIFDTQFGNTGYITISLFLVVAGVVVVLSLLAHRDIRERKKFEDALQVQHDKAQSYLNVVGVMVVALNNNGDVILINRTGCELLGYGEDEMLNRNWFDTCVPIRLREDARAFFEKLLIRDDTSIRYLENPVVTKDGRELTVAFHYSPVKEQAGLTTGVLFSGENITERKLAEIALAESEERFRLLFSKHDTVMLLVDPDSLKIIDANNAAEQFYGFSAAELRSMSICDINPLPVGDIKHVCHLALTEKLNQFIFSHRLADGEIRTVEVHTSPIKQKDGILLFSIIFDITDRKIAEHALRESEQTMNSILSASPVGIALIRNRTVEWVNQAVITIFEYESELEIVGKSTSIFCPSQNDDEHSEQIFSEELEGSAVLYRETRFVKKSGSFFDAEARLKLVAPSTSSDRKILTVIDVTDKLAAKRERDELQSQLLRAQRMEAIGTLAGGIAHDFNNLLQVVIGYCELMAMNPNFPDQYRRCISSIHKSALGGANLVGRLLTFARKSDTKLTPINLNDKILEISELLERTIPKMIQIKLNLSHAPTIIKGDTSEIEQIMMNLAVNSTHAMPDGGILKIETENVHLDQTYCSIHPQAAPGPHVLLTLSDNGSGMDEETMERIFEPFFTTKAAGAGTGLGLSMVYGIVKRYGGHILCHSKLGKGTTIQLYFPAQVAQPEPDNPSNSKPPLGSGEKILLVDDDESVLELARELLIDYGYNVLTASNGREAIDKYTSDRHGIALVILDLFMPMMGGKVCLKTLLEMYPEVRILVVSGFAQDSTVRDVLALGAKGFMSKPFEASSLLEKIRNILETGV